MIPSSPILFKFEGEAQHSDKSTSVSRDTLVPVRWDQAATRVYTEPFSATISQDPRPERQKGNRLWLPRQSILPVIISRVFLTN